MLFVRKALYNQVILDLSEARTDLARVKARLKEQDFQMLLLSRVGAIQKTLEGQQARESIVERLLRDEVVIEQMQETEQALVLLRKYVEATADLMEFTEGVVKNDTRLNTRQQAAARMTALFAHITALTEGPEAHTLLKEPRAFWSIGQEEEEEEEEKEQEQVGKTGDDAGAGDGEPESIKVPVEGAIYEKEATQVGQFLIVSADRPD